MNTAAFDKYTSTVFFSNDDGTLNVFREESPNAPRTVETVQTQVGAKNMTVDDHAHPVFLSAAEQGSAVRGKKSSAAAVTFNVLLGCSSCPVSGPGAAK
ncbi:MAG: hypothetical protein ACLQPN_22575 [Bryobacteraceae bacterium]